MSLYKNIRRIGRKLKSTLLLEKEYISYLEKPYCDLLLSDQSIYKLCKDYEFNTVLDIGAGSGSHSQIFRGEGKSVTAVDFGTSEYFVNRDTDYEYIKGDFLKLEFTKSFDCVWASHVLEHQPDSVLFLKKMIELTNEDGVIAITVPPLKNQIVGGHLSLWNAGLLLYNLVFAGLDCSDAAVKTWGYNVAVIVRKKLRPDVMLDYDTGDINRLRNYFPMEVSEYFNGVIESCNWD